jgi:penicillin-binding protein 2
MEFAVAERAIRACFRVGIAVLAVLFGYSMYLGIVRHELYAKQAESNRLRLVFEQAPRGIIYDRFGEVLAKNKEVFDVRALALALPPNEQELREIADRLAGLIGADSEETFASLSRVKNLAYAEPMPLWTDISREAAAAIEKEEKNLAGIQVSGRYVRVYTQGSAFSHLLGYTGAISQSEFEQLPNVFINDVIGRSGVEAAYDALLRGRKGIEEIEINAMLEIVDMRRSAASEPGENLHLTVDAGLQKKIYDTMRSHMIPRGLGRGAAVALNPQTGEVLALVSLPSFDNNYFVQGISPDEHSRLMRSPGQPFFNRAVQGVYSPGSTIKPLLAVAAIEERIIEPETRIDASRGYISIPNPYNPARPSIFRDWRPHGWMDMRRAIAWSSNVYFYIVGGGYRERSGLGISRIADYLERFGFGSPTGIDLPGEAKGLVPDPEWKRANRPADPLWRVGDTYITSIGQGDVLVTPLQLAVAYSALANGGYIVRPHIVASENNTDSTRRNLGLSQESIRISQEGMRLTITAGSAQRLNALPVATAGKTGTVQVAGGREHAMFAAYAPEQNPSMALVIIVEHGGGGGPIAVPIAHDVLYWYWENRLNSADSRG